MKKVIFNADDYGYSQGINKGIVEASNNGVVRSTTMMANMPGFDHGVSLLPTAKNLKVGVHLCLTTGKSLGGVYKTLTDENGSFLSLTQVIQNAKDGKIDLSEVEAEYTLQIEKIINAGIKPTHFDGHHHSQNLNGVVDVFLKLAKKYNVAVRIEEPSKLSGEYANIKTTSFDASFFGDNVTQNQIDTILSTSTDHINNTIEVMCHPGYADDFVMSSSSYNKTRETELEILTNHQIKELIQQKGYALSDFCL